ncbi:MAG TPA: hypothetical protein GX728_00875 [Clostridiaceae bacterium]|nr:hypothetical protein [Clostridiaceae bacterium]
MSNDARLDGFNPCPLCGRKDYLWADSEESYERGLERYMFSSVAITCNRCGLTLQNFQKELGFDERRTALRKQWNRLAAVPESSEVPCDS